jgi:hypothetical protein
MFMFSVSGQGAVPVVPGLSGFGTNTPAGRGGTVYRVTNLNETGSGSLRACIEASGPRVCVFEISGVIRWTNQVNVYNPYLTIAGQTAPSPGIMLRGGKLKIYTHDVLIQHLTIRVGDEQSGESVGDSLQVNNYTGTISTGIVIDHCTFSWGTDEIVDFWHGFRDITLANSIISEGLNDSPVTEYAGYGMITGPESTGRLSLIGNLFAHNIERNPLSKTGEFVFVNNIVYNWPKDASRVANEGDVRSKNAFVGNLYVRGPDYRSIAGAQTKPIWFDYSLAPNGNVAFLTDNAEVTAFTQTPTPPSDQWTLASISSQTSRGALEISKAPTWPSGLTARPVKEVGASVLTNAGARPADRSKKDAEMISDVRNGTGTYVHCVNSSSSYSGSGYISSNIPNCDRRNAGGWPTYAQNRRALSLPSNPSGDDDGDGYTNLEEWLHKMAAEVEGRASSKVPAAPTNVAAN